MREPKPESMREMMLAAMSATLAQIVATNARADELVRAAHADIDPAFAAAMQDHARRYRVEVLELQGRLASLSGDYTRRCRRWCLLMRMKIPALRDPKRAGGFVRSRISSDYL